MNWHTFFFMLFALVACGFAVAVVLSANIVRMAFYLVLALAGTSGLFFLAGSDFIGAMQLLIYVGGTLVLLVFGVMLTAQSPFVSMKTRGGDWVLAALVGGSLLALLGQAAFSVDDWQGKPDNATEVALTDPTSTKVGMALTGVRVDKLGQENVTEAAGLSGYLLPFEIVSVHLLVVLVGAAYLARAKRRAVPRDMGVA